MRHYQAAAVLAAFVALAACNQQQGSSTGPGLTGASREAFVTASINSCTQTAQSDPRNGSIPAATITQYCTCYSNRMADTISAAEVQALNADPSKLQTLQPRIEAAVKACRPAQTGG